MNHKFQQFLKNSDLLPKINQSQGQYRYILDLIGCKCIRDREVFEIDDECPHFHLDYPNDCQSMIMSYFQSLNTDLLVKNIPLRYGKVKGVIREIEDDGYRLSLLGSDYEQKMDVESHLLSTHIKDVHKKIVNGFDVMSSKKKRWGGWSIFLEGGILYGKIEMERCSERSTVYHISRELAECAVIVVKRDVTTMIVPTYKYFHKYKTHSIYRMWRYIQNRLRDMDDNRKILDEDCDMFSVYNFENNVLTLEKKKVVSFSKATVGSYPTCLSGSNFSKKISITEFSPFLSFCLFVVEKY
ncbi:MAG: hypothetical protein PHG66_01745 [Candidatus Colwellbacteria bacterium]|nr:hypothetical protein [Candidatus Colwellbacteria bacterium]